MSSEGKLSYFNDINLIATGGMANIYKAIHPQLDRHVVIKELKEKLSDDPILLDRFNREAKTLARMYHQNIIHVYDYWETARNRYIVMEFVDGLDLNKIIERVGTLPFDVALNIGVQILYALNYTHKKDIIHRDIKPHNVMVNVSGEAKLMDYGIASKDEDRSLTKPGTVIGTPNYMSPEQVVGDTLDFRSDLFSFGVMMYEMLTGVLPFEDGSDGSVYTKIRTFKHVSVREINRHVPRSLAAVVDRCLRKEPKKRFSSTLDLLHQMEFLLKKELRGLDINEHLMKFFLDNDLYKQTRENNRTTNFSQKVTKIVKERAEEFQAHQRLEMARAILTRLIVAGVVVALGWGVYSIVDRYYSRSQTDFIERLKEPPKEVPLQEKIIYKINKSPKHKKRGQ